MDLKSVSDADFAKGILSKEGNVWRYDGNNLYLTFAQAKFVGREDDDDADLYYVDLGRVQNKADICDWLAQVSEKNWATDKILADLVRAFDIVVGLR